MNSIVLSKMARHVLSRMPLSCYQKSKREFPSGKTAKFGSLNSSNQENKSSGSILTVPEPVDNRFERGSLFEWNSTPPSERNLGCADLNTTKYYSRVRWTSTGIAESRPKPLACECQVGRGGRMPYAETFECSDMTSEVRRGGRRRDLRKEVRVSRCWTLRLERRGGLYRPRSRQGGVLVRAVRDRPLDVDVASERAFLVRKSCRTSQLGPIQPLRTAHRGAS